MKSRIFILVFLFCFFSFCISAQEEQTDLLTEESVFIIDSVDFDTTGKSLESRILYNSEIKIGDEIQGYLGLINYIEEKKQLLNNVRLFESVNIFFRIDEPQQENDGKHPVNLLIQTNDSGNFMILPEPSYNSNTGLLVNLKVRHYNFLGTMIPLKLEFGYRYDQNSNHHFSFANDTDIPFNFLGFNWNINFDNDIRYRTHLNKPFYYENITGLSFKIPVSVINIDTTVSVNMLVNDENTEAEKQIFGDVYTGLYAIPGISNSISFGRIDWIVNFREGVFLDLTNSYYFNQKKFKYGNNPHEVNTTFTGAYHKNAFDAFMFSARVMYRYNYMDFVNDKAADALRGIIDEDIHAKHMLSLNLDMPVKLITFFPHKWYGIDLFLGPFVDMALYNNFKDLLVTSGFELLCYLYRFRSLYFRISFGVPIKGPVNENNFELYFGTELHF